MANKDNSTDEKTNRLYLAIGIAMAAFIAGIAFDQFLIAPKKTLYNSNQYVLPDNLETRAGGIIIKIDGKPYKIVYNPQHKPIFQEEQDIHKK